MILIEWFLMNKMQAKSNKFQVLAVGKKTIEKQISKSNLTCEKTVIELGIEIDCQLNFDVHINLISDLKASKRYNTFGLYFG